MLFVASLAVPLPKGGLSASTLGIAERGADPSAKQPIPVTQLALAQ